jgi:hypothetical protein
MVGNRHPDFEKIHNAFLQHYSKDPQLGEQRYSDWVKDSNLDETQSYYLQGVQRATGTKQNFDWAKLILEFVKEDQDAYYYKVEALFPVESMNKDTPTFTRDEVLQAARSLTGKPSDLNHDHSKTLEGVEITAAQFEDDCVEFVCRVAKISPLVGMIERKEIVSVSIEGEWSHGVPGQGLVLTGLGWLTKQTTLPGIPLTRIMPVEQIAESFKPTAVEQMEPQMPGEYFLGFTQDASGFLAEHYRVVWLDQANGIIALNAKTRANPALERCQSILFLASKWQPNTVADWLTGHPDYQVSASVSITVQSNQGIEKLEEKDLDLLAERVMAKIGRKDSENLKVELAESKKLLQEAETKAKQAEELCLKTAGELTKANNLIEGYKRAAPGVDLLAVPPVLMPVTEHIAVLERLVPPVMVERSSMGMKLEGQAIRAELFKAKEKLKVK